MRTNERIKEIHRLSEEELDIEVARVRRKMFELRSQAVTEKIEDTSQFGKLRKDLARLLTERNMRAKAQAANA